MEMNLHPAIKSIRWTPTAATHTPTPWQVHSDTWFTQIIGNMDVDNRCTMVASTDSDDANDSAVDAANARRIVAAVNAHDDLVKLAQEFLRLFGSDDSTNPLDMLARRGLERAGLKVSA